MYVYHHHQARLLSKIGLTYGLYCSPNLLCFALRQIELVSSFSSMYIDFVYANPHFHHVCIMSHMTTTTTMIIIERGNPK